MHAAAVEEMTPQRLCCLRAATPHLNPLALQHTAGASALKASGTGTVYSTPGVVAVYTAAAADTKGSGAAITAEAGATDSADTVATTSATGAVVADMAGEGAASTVSTDAMYSTNDATHNDWRSRDILVHSSRRQPSCKGLLHMVLLPLSEGPRQADEHLLGLLAESVRQQKPRSEPRRNLC